MSECNTLPAAQAGIRARVLAIEAFDEFVFAAGRQAHGGKDAKLASKVSDSLAPLLLSLTDQLYQALHHLDLLSDQATFFSRFVRVVTHLMAMPAHVSGLMRPSEVLAPFNNCVSSATSLSDVALLTQLLKGASTSEGRMSPET